MRKTILLAAVALFATACVSKSEYDRQLAQAAALSAEKDSLLSEVVATSQFIGDVSAQLEQVRTNAPMAARDGEMESLSPTEQRAALLQRVTELTARIKEAEASMASSRRRISALTAGNSALTAKYDSTIASFQQLIETQKAEVVALVDRVTALTAENTQLKEANVQLASEREALTADRETLVAEQNTVYWVAGSKAELLERGIIEQRGGMLGIGRTLVLARTIDTEDFEAADRRELGEIPLPDSTKNYRIVSPNDLAGLDSTPVGGKFKGSMRISAPETFWRPSRFLVLVEL
jgi:phenylpyruvate tautomerase PptA (4-oxalocrotonate tautomerase family)